MVRKLRELASTGADDATLMNAVCQSAHQIWQAGLGAFAAAQGQGEALFGKLVERGAQVQKQIEDGAGQALPAPVAGSWEKLEKVFEDRVGRALHGLGVPTREDLAALQRQVDALNQALSRVPADAAGAPRPGRKRTASAARAATAASPADAAASSPAVRKRRAPARAT